MYYTGIYSENGNYLAFVSIMHRKTAKRVYQPCLFKKMLNPAKEDLEAFIKKIYLDSDFIILKKKFSQSGRPARKVITHPYFIINNDLVLSQILDRLRISYFVINFDEKSSLQGMDVSVDFSKALNSVFEEKRINFVEIDSLSDFEKLIEKSVLRGSFDSMEEAVKAFGLICLYNEKYNKKIKRY